MAPAAPELRDGRVRVWRRHRAAREEWRALFAVRQLVNAGTLSLGLYFLAAGSIDAQSPHAEDEIYYVIAGRGGIDVAGERRGVQSGSIIFVAKDVVHRFVDIDEDLSILVFFAPEHEQ